MNVANRKLFVNRDARQKLASMGGIMASSPELLGEAQKFAPGGQVNKQQYIINVPGLTQPGEYLSVSESTLMMLNDTIPDLMSQQNTLVEPADLVGGYVKARPGDAVVGTRLRRMAEESAGAAPTLEAALETPTIRDYVREQLASTYSKSPAEAILENLTPDSENQMVQMVESGLQSMGVEDPSAAIPGPQGAVTGLTPSQKFQSESLNPMNIGPTELNLPAVRNALRDPNALSAGLASSLQEAAANGPVDQAAPEVQPELTVQRRTVDTPAFKELQRQLAEQRTEVPGFNMPGESMSIGEQMIAQGFTGGDIDPNDPSGSTLSGSEFILDPTQGYPYPTDAPKEETSPESDPMNIINVLEAATETSSAEELAKKAQEIQEQKSERESREGPPTRGGPAKVREDEPETAAPAAADTSPLDTAEIEETANDPDSSPADRNKKTSAKVLGGLGVPNADKMGINERVSTYEKLFKEMLGEKDEDVAKEMWHNMAMIGFSIAAGESPNALKNIASGLLEGTKMMREDRATRQAREDKIGMLALEAGMADKRAEEKYARDLALVGARASAKPTKGYLDTQSGQLIEKIYTDIMSDVTINEDEKVARFVQRVGGDQANLFFGATGLPSGTGSTTTTTLADI